MAALANGTGGTYIHNTNNLERGLKDLTSAPEYMYLLEFHAKNLKRNGSYHTLKVTVAYMACESTHAKAISLQGFQRQRAARLPERNCSNQASC